MFAAFFLVPPPMLALPTLAAATLVALPEVAGFPPPHPYGVSRDGAYVVGGFSPANGFVYRTGSAKLARFTPGGRAVYPNAVSSGGTIVGVDENAFSYRAGRFVSLKPLAGDIASVASAISPDGTVAGGYSQGDNGRFRGVLWIGGTPREVAVPTGYVDGHVRGIAANGSAAVGVTYDSNRDVRAFLWRPLVGSRLLTLPDWARESAADAITPDGRLVVGYVAAKSTIRPALWDNAGSVRVLNAVSAGRGLQAAGSAALAIDPAGRWIGGYDGGRAVLWGRDGAQGDLARMLGARAAGWSFEQIVGIGRSSDRVTLAGWGKRNGRLAGFVVTFRERSTAGRR